MDFRSGKFFSWIYNSRSDILLGFYLPVVGELLSSLDCLFDIDLLCKLLYNFLLEIDVDLGL